MIALIGYDRINTFQIIYSFILGIVLEFIGNVLTIAVPTRSVYCPVLVPVPVLGPGPVPVQIPFPVPVPVPVLIPFQS